MDESFQPLTEDEVVYRRIHRNYYCADLPLPVSTEAFRPNRNDTTGLSVFRARFVQPQETLMSVRAGKGAEYYVVQLAVRDLQRLGMSVVPEPDPPRSTWPRCYSTIELAQLSEG